MGALFIVLAFLMIRAFGINLKFKFDSPQNNAVASISPEPSIPKTAINWEKPAQLPVLSRDPMNFSSLPSPKKDSQAVKEIEIPVNGIVWGAGKSSAIIEGKILHEGETVRGASILKINQNSVEFEIDGKRWTQYTH